jgi:hypothetical protein
MLQRDELEAAWLGPWFYSPEAVPRKEGGGFDGGFGRWNKENFVPTA